MLEGIDLVGSQRNTKGKVELLGRIDARIQQRNELRLGIAVVTEISASGCRSNLVVHQFLFIEAVTQTFLYGLWIERQAAQQVVAGDEVLIAGETRISDHQIWLARLRMDGVKTAGGKRDG